MFPVQITILRDDEECYLRDEWWGVHEFLSVPRIGEIISVPHAGDLHRAVVQMVEHMPLAPHSEYINELQRADAPTIRVTAKYRGTYD